MSTTKANNYLQLLDTARCNGDWANIPELCRKVKKHAPGRKCLTLVAETEERLRLLPTPARNSQATTTTSYNAQLDELRDRLLDEIESYPNPLPKLPTPAGGGKSSVTTEDDILQARIIAAWISSLKNEWAEVLASIPGEEQVGEGRTVVDVEKSEYMDIMRVKALVLKGLALSHTNADTSHALQLYKAATRLPESFSAPVQNCSIFRLWAEKALAQYALAAYRFWVEEHVPAPSPVAGTAPASPPKLGIGPEESRPATAGSTAQEPVGVAIGRTVVDDTTVASAFREFHKFIISGATGSRPSTSTRLATKESLRRSVYMSYFKFLSLILLPANHPRRPATLLRNTPSPNPQESTVSIVSSSGMTRKTSNKGTGSEEQLRAELKEIQLIYERYLINGLPYPKADEYHEVIGEWVDQIVENWRASGGSGEDAAPVVEILYRASQKTFHSPRILRHLFFTLTATGNFRDAFAALKTYLDLVEKAKERMQKGQKELDFDTDKIVVTTAVDGIRVLCKFIGSGEKAIDVARRLEKWITAWRIRDKDILQEAYRGIGMATSTWAKQVPDGDQREGIQEEAVLAYKKALGYDPYDIQAWYGAALVEAELGRVDDAIESTRRGLGALKCNYLENDGAEYTEGGAREYKRWAVPLLHVLALLKTAKEDFDDAEKVCRNAFDIVGDGREAVSDFGVTDKVAVFELMMTRLAITEAVDDPEAAIVMADGLIGLYGMLFDGTHLVQRFDLGTNEGAVSRPTTTASRKSRLFGRHKKQFSSSVTSLPPQGEVPSQTPSRSGTLKKQRPKSGHQSLDGPIGLAGEQNTPKIQVTGTSDGASTPNAKSNRKSLRSSSVSGGTIRRMRSLGSIRLKSEVKPEDSPTPPLPSSTETSSLNFGGSDRQNGRDPHLFHMLKSKLHRHQLQQASDSAAASSTSIVSYAEGTVDARRSGEIRIEDLPNNLPQKKLPLPLGAINRTIPADREGETPRSLKRPSQLPEPKLAVEEERRQVLGVLRKAWLCVAGLYRRAGHLGDAAMAVEEANGLIATDGDGEADVLAEKGYLALANDKKAIAADYFETAIAIDYDHPQAIIGLTKLLLAECTGQSTDANDGASSRTSSSITESSSSQLEEEEDESTTMDRLTARDRSMGLLERLVWSPRGWNISKAHYLLSQAHENAGEIEKAKAALWRVVELEDGTGVRGWSSCGVGIV